MVSDEDSEPTVVSLLLTRRMHVTGIGQTFQSRASSRHAKVGRDPTPDEPHDAFPD